MKRIIAVMLAVVLVISGVSSFAYANDAVNEVGADSFTHWEYRTSGDTFENQEVTGEKHWHTWLNNSPDDGELVYEPNVTLDSDLIFDWVSEEYLEPDYPPYHWLFDNIPDGEGEHAGVGFESPSPYTVTFTPGFDAYRSADITEFLQSDGMQVQTITVAVTPMVTPQEKMQTLNVCVDAWEDDLVNTFIRSATTDGPNVSLYLDEHHVWIGVYDDEGIATCTFTITIEVTPRVDLVEFMPEVCVEWPEVYDSVTISGSSVSGRADPDDEEIGTWTWSAAGSYEWRWLAQYMRRVTFPREIEIVPVNEVGAEFITNWEYRTSGDTFTNHEVTGVKHWFTILNNSPDATHEPVTEVTLTLASGLEFEQIHPEPVIMEEPRRYQWSFDDVDDSEGVDASLGLWSPSPYTVTFTPGFDASRSANITEFLYSDGMQVQTLSVTVTTEKWMEELGVGVDAWEDDLINSVITEATADGPNIYIDIRHDGHSAWIIIHELEAGTYNFTFLIEVTPKVYLVEFMPRVSVDQEETLFSDTASGGSVSYAADPDDEIGTWTWSAGESYAWDLREARQMSVTFPREIAPIEVEIDIKPGSDPNSINLKSKGVVPVAVLTTNDFDASIVDPKTVVFAGASPVRWNMEDVDGDGNEDMLFFFKTQELDLTKESTEATLTGKTTDGTDIIGTDTVNIVPKGKGPK